MLIYRLNNGVSLLRPARSICPKCKKELSLAELIPLYSYIKQKGKCTHCKKKIPSRYLYTELSYALLGIFACLVNMPVLFFILSLILLAVVISDIEYQEIPYTLMFGSLACILWLGTLTWTNLVYVGAFALIILGLETFIYKRQIFGGADTLLFSILGLHFSTTHFFLFIYLSFVLGLIGALWGLSILKMKRQDALPFAPYIIISFYITHYWGSTLLNTYWKLLGV
jgi:prepilin signal peptidase PulO-like enzyme (type II secretory pathway)